MIVSSLENIVPVRMCAIRRRAYNVIVCIIGYYAYKMLVP